MKKERPKCDVCGVTHWAGEPHRIDPAIAADIIKKLELRIVELENQLAAARDVPIQTHEPPTVADSTSVYYGISSASICMPPSYANQLSQMQANAMNAQQGSPYLQRVADGGLGAILGGFNALYR